MELNKDAIYLELFEDNFTDILNSLELWDLEIQAMKEFTRFHSDNHTRV